MNTYIVGFVNFFDNDLILEQVQAHTGLAAMKQFMEDPMYDDMDLDEFLQTVWDQDSLIQYIHI